MWLVLTMSPTGIKLTLISTGEQKMYQMPPVLGDLCKLRALVTTFTSSDFHTVKSTAIIILLKKKKKNLEIVH